MPTSLDELRRFALGRSLFAPTTLERAIRRLGFIQADPLRAPARAQDLTLFQRVKGYRAGDLERRYEKLAVEEDFFVNYGFLSRAVHALMHPRSGFTRESRARAKQAEAILAFVRARGAVHPREVERHFGSGKEKHWSGTSNTTTRLLDSLHYRGLLRVARRDAGIRVYAAVDADGIVRNGEARGDIDALIDLAVQKYAPLPAASLAKLVVMLRYAAPQWRSERKDGLVRAKRRLASASVGGTEWFWPRDEALDRREYQAVNEGRVRLLSPFDPVVWDRKRFELFWGWPYRFEAYTPAPKRKLGYYALPLIWGERVIGWANLTFAEQRLSATFGYVGGKPPRDPVFRRALEEELTRFDAFMQPRRRVK
jgi:uncharacterized protein YcaQ